MRLINAPRWRHGLLVLAVAVAACDRFSRPTYGTYNSNAGGASAEAASDGDVTTPGCIASAIPASAPGAPCVKGSDCEATCCACADRQWLAASCVAGTCAGGDIACQRTGACAAVVALPPAETCGASYGDATCDACLHESCCAEEAACGSDPSCAPLEDCLFSACADACP